MTTSSDHAYPSALRMVTGIAPVYPPALTVTTDSGHAYPPALRMTTGSGPVYPPTLSHPAGP
ncbi:hypothetical protein ACLBSL_20500, partial [Klebsiella pneumoniae]|uniref:hypothetical protein n=1 Tax=Klebsiella pneumoniae TaxID=573 RepID=UPI003968B6F8